MSSVQAHDWETVVLCFKKTKIVLQLYVKEMLESQIDKWPESARSNFEEFSKRVNEDKDFVSLQKQAVNLKDVSNWNIKSDRVKFEAVLQEILNLHVNPKPSRMNLASNSYEFADLYWILAKMFMPYGNTDSRDHNDVDLLSFFDLLRNCTCFSSLDEDGEATEIIDELCTIRRTVLKSDTTTDKYRFIDTLEKFLGLTYFRNKKEIKTLKEKLNKLKSSPVIFEPIGNLENLLQTNYNWTYVEKELADVSNWYVTEGMGRLKKEIQIGNKMLDEQEKKKLKYKVIGGVTGVTVVGGTGAAVAGVTASLIGAAAFTPALVVGGIGAGIGYIGGSAGGAVISLFKKIL